MHKYQRLPPHVSREWQVKGRQYVLNRIASNKVMHANTHRSRIHPRVGATRGEFADLLGIDDPSELASFVNDLQVLVERCLLHLRSGMVHRTEIRSRRIRGARAGTTAAAPKRGRRTGASNFAARQLGLGLAFLWSEQTGRTPGRSHDALTGLEGGAYRTFVTLVLTAIPRKVLRKGKGQITTPDYFVRQSIRDFKEARNAPEEYRRRGLIDEGSWIRSSANRLDADGPMSH